MSVHRPAQTHGPYSALRASYPYSATRPTVSPTNALRKPRSRSSGILNGYPGYQGVEAVDLRARQRMSFAAVGQLLHPSVLRTLANVISL